MLKSWYTMAEAAKVLGYYPENVMAQHRKKNIDTFRVNGVLCISRATLLAWVKEIEGKAKTYTVDWEKVRKETPKYEMTDEEALDLVIASQVEETRQREKAKKTYGKNTEKNKKNRGIKEAKRVEEMGHALHAYAHGGKIKITTDGETRIADPGQGSLTLSTEELQSGVFEIL